MSLKGDPHAGIDHQHGRAGNLSLDPQPDHGAEKGGNKLRKNCLFLYVYKRGVSPPALDSARPPRRGRLIENEDGIGFATGASIPGDPAYQALRARLSLAARSRGF